MERRRFGARLVLQRTLPAAARCPRAAFLRALEKLLRVVSVPLIVSVFCAGGSQQSEEEQEVVSRGRGVCKWFNMRMGFGFISMDRRDGAALDQPLDVFVHQVRCDECCYYGNKNTKQWRVPTFV